MNYNKVILCFMNQMKNYEMCYTETYTYKMNTSMTPRINEYCCRGSGHILYQIIL